MAESIRQGGRACCVAKDGKENPIPYGRLNGGMDRVLSIPQDIQGAHIHPDVRGKRLL